MVTLASSPGSPTHEQKSDEKLGDGLGTRLWSHYEGPVATSQSLGVASDFELQLWVAPCYYALRENHAPGTSTYLLHDILCYRLATQLFTMVLGRFWKPLLTSLWDL